MSQATSDVVIVGAGMIGTAVAWRCAQQGLSVRLVDPAPNSGAWHTAAGMLAPITELHYGETALLRLSLESLAVYPDFVAELEQSSGAATGFRACGTVAVAWDAADLAALRDLHAFGAELGIAGQLITGTELRRLEPALAAGLPGAWLAAGDHQVDPRQLHAALLAALSRLGVAVTPSAARIEVVDDRAVGVRLADTSLLTAGTTVLAAGAWSAQVDGVPGAYRLPVRPVKGQTLRVRLPGAPRLSRVVRAVVKGSPVYLVPRADGEIVIGASSEETGFDVRPRAGAVYELLRDAQSLLPELGEATLTDVSTGLRPGSPDNAPIVGPSGLAGLVHASGHYRNGVLLAPVTAAAVTELILTGALPAAMSAFTPGRFAALSPVGAP